MNFYFYCADPHEPECFTKRQHLRMPEGIVPKRMTDAHLWRVARHLSLMTERYQALLNTDFSFERTHHRGRQRHGQNGNDLTVKPKRMGLQVHRLRNAVARLIDWSRICLRTGWTIARLCRRVWAAWRDYCDMPKLTAD